jgi:hypothetical protein
LVDVYRYIGATPCRRNLSLADLSTWCHRTSDGRAFQIQNVGKSSVSGIRPPNTGIPMKCVKCGTAVEANEKFCSGCGAPAQTPQAPTQSTNLCQDCGYKLDPAEKFCPECGVAVDAVPPEIATPDKKATVSKTTTQPESVSIVAPTVPILPPKPAAVNEPAVVALAMPEPPKISVPDEKIASQKIEPVTPPPTPQPAVPPAATATLSPIKPKTSPRPAAARPQTGKQPNSNTAKKVIYGILGVIVAALVGLVVIGAVSETKSPDAAPMVAVQPSVEPPAPLEAAPQPAVAPIATASTPIANNSADTAAAVPVVTSTPEPVPQPTTATFAEAKPRQLTGTPVQKLVATAIEGRKDEFQVLLQELQSSQETGSVNSAERKQARKLNDEAFQAMKEQKYRLAVEILQKATTVDPYDIEIGDNLGYAQRLAGNYLESEAQIISVIERRPTRGQAWFNLGETYSKLGRSPQAVAVFMTAYSLSKNPEKTMTLYTSLAEKTSDEQFRENLRMAIQKINSPK